MNLKPHLRLLLIFGFLISGKGDFHSLTLKNREKETSIFINKNILK